MQIIKKGDLNAMFGEESVLERDIPYYISEINKSLVQSEGKDFIGLQIVLTQDDFSTLINKIQGAGYAPSWEEVGEVGESGQVVFNLKIPTVEGGGEAPLCDNCLSPLMPLHFLGSDGTQFNGNLYMALFGGYGMYMDTRSPSSKGKQFVKDSSAEINFCRNCADALCASFPGFERAMDRDGMSQAQI